MFVFDSRFLFLVGLLPLVVRWISWRLYGRLHVCFMEASCKLHAVSCRFHNCASLLPNEM